MSYDIEIKNKNDEVVEFPCKHGITGGTYALGGTDKAWLNVTYNYADSFYRVMGENGIRSIYGLSPKDSLPVLDAAIIALGDATPSDNYWDSCDGNAKKALINLRHLAELAILYFPNEELHWDGD